MSRSDDDSDSAGTDESAAAPVPTSLPDGSLRQSILVLVGVVLIVGAVRMAYASGSNPYEHNAWECNGEPYEQDSPYRYRYEELSPSTGTLMVAFLIGALGVVVAVHGSGRVG